MSEPVPTEGQVLKGEEGTVTESSAIRLPLTQLGQWRERLTNSLFRAVLVLGVLVFVAETALNAEMRRWDLVGLMAGVYLILAVLAFARRVSSSIRAGVLIFILYTMGALSLTQSGLGGEGRTLMLLTPLLALILLGIRAGVMTAGVCTLTLVAVGLLMGLGYWRPRMEPSSTELLPWLSAFAVYLLLAALMLIPAGYAIGTLVANLGRALEEAQRRWREVRQLSRSLEQQVEERTARLARRSAQLEAAARVAREVAAIRDVEQLLQEAVGLISERFGLYHAGIFLMDQAGEWLIMKAASSGGGQRMVQRGYRVRVGGEDPVGRAAVRRSPVRRTASPGIDDLPLTKTEVALPLIARERVIGVLDLHSVREDAFDEEEVAILQVMADQIALAIDNTRLLVESQKALERVRRYQVEETLRSWREALLRRGIRLAYLYDQLSVRPLPPDETPLPIGRGSLPGRVTVHSYPDGRSVLVAPIRVYDRTIGVLSFEAHRTWGEDEIALVEAAVEQMGLALENARLLEETRRRAERERLVADITARVRASADVETILRTAVREIGAALGTDRTFVQVGVDRSPSAGGSGYGS